MALRTCSSARPRLCRRSKHWCRPTVVGCVTQLTKPRGRGQKRPTPVKATAERAGIAVLQPNRLKTNGARRDPAVRTDSVSSRMSHPSLSGLDIPRLGMINARIAAASPARRPSTRGHRGRPRTGIDHARVLRARCGTDAGEAPRRDRPGGYGVRISKFGSPLGAELRRDDRSALHGGVQEETQDEQLVTYAACPRASAPSIGSSRLRIHNDSGLQPWRRRPMLQGKRGAPLILRGGQGGARNINDPRWSPP